MANENLNVESTNSQNAMILAYLRDGNKITPLEAERMFGCMRLGARIADLSDRLGYNLPRKRVQVTNRFGKEVWVMQYWVEDKDLNKRS